MLRLHTGHGRAGICAADRDSVTKWTMRDGKMPYISATVPSGTLWRVVFRSSIVNSGSSKTSDLSHSFYELRKTEIRKMYSRVGLPPVSGPSVVLPCPRHRSPYWKCSLPPRPDPHSQTSYEFTDILWIHRHPANSQTPNISATAPPARCGVRCLEAPS